jgi:hypothetical protein
MAEFPKVVEVGFASSFAVVKPGDILVVKPGDTLVVAVRSGFSEQEADEMAVKLQQLLPGVRAVIVPANQLMVYRP